MLSFYADGVKHFPLLQILLRPSIPVKVSRPGPASAGLGGRTVAGPSVRTAPRPAARATRRHFARRTFALATLVGAAAASQLVKNLLYGVSSLDPVAFAAVPLVLLAVATLAVWLPARRAASVEPVTALRTE